MNPATILLGIGAVVIVLALAWEHRHYIWHDDE